MERRFVQHKLGMSLPLSEYDIGSVLLDSLKSFSSF
jgi:hypothetical protein